MHKLIRTTVPLVLALCFVLPSASAQDSPITKDTVIQMVKAGLPDEVIINKINGEAVPPKLSIDDLIAIKSAGASDAVLKALVPVPAARAETAVSAAAAADPDDPMAEHDSGVYIRTIDPASGKKKMTMIERAAPGHMKEGGQQFFSNERTLSVEIPGAHAVVRAQEPHPEFYMYFLHTGLGGSSPTQYSLIQLDPKKDCRETSLFKPKPFGTSKIGVDDSAKVEFSSEKIAPYAYKITAKADLTPGEYAFVTSYPDGAFDAVHDFGVDDPNAPVPATNFTSKPDGADLFVDGMLAGKTPMSFSLARGEHLIKIHKKGYKDWEKQFVSPEDKAVNAELQKGQ